MSSVHSHGLGSFSILADKSPRGMAALSWLWEDRIGETVSPRPLHQTPRGHCRPEAAWDEIASVYAASASDNDPSMSGSPAPHGSSGQVALPDSPQPISELQYGTFDSRSAPSRYMVPVAPRQRPEHPRNGGRRRQMAAMGRPASLLTIAAAEFEPAGSSAMWRGIGLPKTLAKVKLQSKELARHRRESALQKAAEDRAQSKAYRESVMSSMIYGESHYDSSGSYSVGGESPTSESGFGFFSGEMRKSRTITDHELDGLGDFSRNSAAQKSVARQNVLGAKNAKGNPWEQTMSEILNSMPDDLAAENSVPNDSPKKSARVRISIMEDTSGKIAAADSRTAKKRGTLTSSAVVSIKEEESSAAESGSPTAAKHGKGRKASLKDTNAASTNRKPAAKKTMLMKSRMRRLLERRKQEFASLPPAEQQRLRQAFNAGDSEGLAMLDSKGLKIALTELGLDGRLPQEKQAVAAIVREATSIRGDLNFFDFVFQMVNEVETKLEEMRSPTLFQEFQQHDTLELGRLKQGQCIEALQQHARSICSHEKVHDEDMQSFWKSFMSEFPTLYKERCHGEGAVDFKGFQLLTANVASRRQEFFQRLEKRIACVESLPPQLENSHFGEMSYLKHIFDSSDSSENSNISVRGVANTLLEAGIAAPVGTMWDRLKQIMDECEGFMFSFKDFLEMADGIRDDMKNVLKSAIQALFRSYNLNTATPPSLVPSEVPDLMLELPVCQDCCTHGNLLAVVEACDKDAGSEMEIDALLALIGQVMEKCRGEQRKREKEKAVQLGFTWREVLRLRMTFAAMSRTGYLEVADVKKWFTEINPHVFPSSKEIAALILEVSPQEYAANFDPRSRRSSEGDVSETYEPDIQSNSSGQHTGMQRHLSISSHRPSSTVSSRRPSTDGLRSAIARNSNTLGLEDAVASAEPFLDDIPLPERPSLMDPLADLSTTANKKELPSPSFPYEEDDHSDDDGTELPVLYFDGYMRLVSMLIKE